LRREVGGLPWLQLPRTLMRSHPWAAALEEEFALVLMDASATDIGLGKLLERAPAELGWCAALPEGDRSEVWEVVGKSAVTVTKGRELCAEHEEELLSVGSLVKARELCFDEGVLHYELLAGFGPEEGWVTLACLQKISDRRPEARSEMPQAPQDEAMVQEALKMYGEAFCKKTEANIKDAMNRSAAPWQDDGEEQAPAAPNAPEPALVEQEINLFLEEVQLEMEKAEFDNEKLEASSDDKSTHASDDEMNCCGECGLPLGELYYLHKGACKVHTECMVQIMLQEHSQEEQERIDQEQRLKKLRHEEFNIGWGPAKIPRNVLAAERLTGQPMRDGLLALALTQEEDGTTGVTLVPTWCPGAAVNLEYLSVALRVRFQLNKEPFFSLDPVDPKLNQTMQIKRFEPYWLKGTRAGDVLFEADYHLKELSLGEGPQPVMGMKSSIDFSAEDKFEEEWAAREWFVVRQAEVHLSEDGVLVPVCKMGVEAREQVLEGDKMEDRVVTRPDHPLVKYAKDFENNFDLIAERKSAIYHLRELAKASILAKHLLESEVSLEDVWFNIFEQDEDEDCILEVPQVWNERNKMQIHVVDGKIVDDAPKNTGSRIAYGGVLFGLDRFRTAPTMAPTMAGAGLQARKGVIPSRMGFQRAGLVRYGLTPKMGAGRMGMVAARRCFVPPRGFVAPSGELAARRGFIAAPSRGSLTPGAMISARPGFLLAPGSMSMPSISATMPLRGVDLNLDAFDLARTDAAPREGSLALSEDLANCTVIGKAFWMQLDQPEGSMFGEEEGSFLRNLFNPSLSDRRSEGDLFVPPDTSAAYGDRLKALLRNESEVCKTRKDLFFSLAFDMGAAGPLFPSSWDNTVEIARGRTAKTTPPLQASLQPCEYKAQKVQIRRVLESSTPVFKKRTEDDVCFRIFRLGSLEVRTCQAPGAAQEIGAVFSVHPADEDPAEGVAIEAGDRIAKVTLYVEGNVQTNHYYLVLETDKGGIIVTEKLRDGSHTWEQNPVGLAGRNALAKVLRTADQLGAQKDAITVHYMKIFQETRRLNSDCKWWAESAFTHASQHPIWHCAVNNEPFQTYALKNFERLHYAIDLAKSDANEA